MSKCGLNTDTRQAGSPRRPKELGSEEAAHAGAAKASLLTPKEIFLKWESSIESMGDNPGTGRPSLGTEVRVGRPLACFSPIAFSPPKTPVYT